MSFAKSKLKLAKEYISKREYSSARDTTLQVLEYEPENYHAIVFLGLSLLELGDKEQSEQAYRKATTLNSEQLLAWQGIAKLYERTEEWAKYGEVLQRLMEIYNDSNEAVKCAETWQKLVELLRNHGTQLQLMDGLSLLLPHSPFYPLLSTLPPPNYTNPTSNTTFTTQVVIHDSLPILKEIVELLEKYEEEYMRKEVENRRTRLNSAGPEQLKKEIGIGLWSTSRLPSLYDEVLNHPKTSDDLRRETDSKLLRYTQRYLHALPNTEEWSSTKANVLKELDNLANGAVILRIPDELAWMIFLEGKDLDNVVDYDQSLIKQFMKLFPESPMTLLLRGYFNYVGIPLTSEEDEESRVEPSEDDPFDIIQDAYSELPRSIIANRVLADVSLAENDYENAIKVAKSGLGLLDRVESNTGRKLNKVRIGYKIILATCFVHFFPPKHHPRALLLINEVLSQSPDNVTCLMGYGYVLQGSNKWEEATVPFGKVNELLPDDLNDGLRAREEKAWCECHLNNPEPGAVSLRATLEILKNLDQRDQDNARCLWRLGETYWRMGGSKREEAYSLFISSLKYNPTYAPAFTSLGIYYSEFASPPDPTRASKCFQKAFELDPREADAARRLAEGFAEDREWDLVEVVARRTIEGEGGLDAGIKDVSPTAGTKYLPTNAWAWKAIGVIELHRRNYPPAIEAFQVALRAEPEDSLSWLRLGEAYSKAGRHIAALKALDRARELKPDNWMCTYLVGEVKQQMGHFEHAIAEFKSILETRSSEVGVLTSLSQAYLDLGQTELLEGFRRRAENSFITCIRVGLRTIHESSGFRAVAWKTVGDAIYSLSNQSSFFNENEVLETLLKVVSLLPTQSDHLPGIISSPSALNLPLSGLKVLEVAAATYSYRISLDSSEPSARTGSTWFDLGIALYGWLMKSRDHPDNREVKTKATQCLTQALRENPGNDMYWVALGDVNFLTHAKAAQHAYIKALEIDPKNVVTWTNLGLLYLHYNDIELANEVLYRVQTLDPDYPVAWVGQALVATANGHYVEARTMFEHVVGLTANVPEADLEFASRIFSGSQLIRRERRASIDTLLPVFFVLDRYCERRPDDASALHLFGLVCESIGHLEAATKLIERVIVILESSYEETEDAEIERRFTIANCNLARLRLSLCDYDGAIGSFESALGLLSPEDDNPTTKLLRSHAHFGSGIASFMQGDLETAVSLFQAALESVDDLATRGHITVLLSKTMWAIQNDEFKETAKGQLLECITADPENLTAINTLAGMGILTDDDNLVDAALSEILALPLERRYELDPRRDVGHLLTQHYLGQEEPEKAVSIAQGALFAEPSHLEVRNELAKLTLQSGKYDSSLSILSSMTAANIVDDLSLLPTSLGLQAVSNSLNVGVDNAGAALREAQRAIVLSPSDIRHWRTLAYVRSKKG